MVRKKIGFLVNPIAGLGGAVGLKGTDGLVVEALNLGATPKAQYRALKCLSQLRDVEARFFTCSSDMGEDVLKKTKLDFGVVYGYDGQSKAQDTRKACEIFRDLGVDLILFCAGDGTARDIYDVVGSQIPILGIPAGVKMHSGVFAVNPSACAKIFADFVEDQTTLSETEVVDVDEDAYRRGKLKTRLFGIAKTPSRPGFIQASKDVFETKGAGAFKKDIAEFAFEFIRDDVMYLLGAGSTVGEIKKRIGFSGTLLGVDAIYEHKLVEADLSEQKILSLLDKYSEARIIVSPIGAQGFVFGRGNQQLSPEVIRRVGVQNIIYVATPPKLEGLRYLRVDTGDCGLDQQLSGYRRVVIGYRLAQRKDVVSEGRK